MPKIKIPKSSPSIDMTPMVDLAFLLVTFFMLAASFRPSEPVSVFTPSSKSNKITPENKLMVTVDNKGLVFLTIGDPEARKATMKKMLDKYKFTLSDKQWDEFYGLTTFGCALKDLPEYLEASENERKKFDNLGIPADSINNELNDWVAFGVESTRARHQVLVNEAKQKGKVVNIEFPKNIIRADSKLLYKKVDKIINSFRLTNFTDLYFETTQELSGKTKE